MSNLAATEDGVIRTAWEFRDDFLSQAIQQEGFFCPFCGITLNDRCIYTDCRMAPHFSLPKGEYHSAHCEPLEAEVIGPLIAPTAARNAGYRVLARDVELPEALVRRRPRQVRVPVPADTSVRNVPMERARTVARDLKDSQIPQRQTTSALRSVVSAYLKVIQAAKEDARTNDVPAKEMWNRVNEIHEDHPLDLYGQRLTYYSAFRNPKGGVLTTPHIYNGNGVFVKLHDGTIELEAEGQMGKFFVVVPPCDDEVQWQRQFRLDLHQAASEKVTVRWFAYGTPRVTPSGAVIEIDSLDDLHVIFNKHRAH